MYNKIEIWDSKKWKEQELEVPRSFEKNRGHIGKSRTLKWRASYLSEKFVHIPVLLQEIVGFLQWRDQHMYLPEGAAIESPGGPAEGPFMWMRRWRWRTCGGDSSGQRTHGAVDRSGPGSGGGRYSPERLGGYPSGDS